MIHSRCRVTARENPGSNVLVLRFHSPETPSTVSPGQFVNIKVTDSGYPLLRRPFSVYHAEREEFSIIFDIRGSGTAILASKRPGETVDIIGPLGSPFDVEGAYSTALLVGGGLGVAPLPMVARAVKRTRKEVLTFLGARSLERVISAHLDDPRVATDDGSSGFRGTVVDLLRMHLENGSTGKPKIFACGPNPMLSVLSQFASERKIPCEVSLESPMACGVGLCQGCPVELRGEEKRFALIRKEGPVFDSGRVCLA